MQAKRITGLLLAAMVVLAFGCDDDETTAGPEPDNGPYNLTFTGTIAPHAGQMLRVVVVKDSDGSIVANESETVAGDGTFSFSMIDVLEKGETYTIDFYADHNSNGACDPPPVDHVWRETVAAVSGNVSRDFQHNTDFTNVCSSFEFDLDFTGTIAPHAGQMFYVAVVDMGTTAVVQLDSVMVAGDGTYEFSWAGIMEDGHSYQVDFYADHNSNGTCDAPPTDHGWRRMTGVIRDDEMLDFQHDVNFTDVCSSFP